jgi:hypothetical protein
MRGILFWLLLLLSVESYSQKNYLQVGVGQSFYRGDLSPYSSRLSFAEGHTAVQIGYYRSISDHWRIGMQVFKGALSADDMESPVASMRDRGLNFHADFSQITLLGSYKVMELKGDKPATGLKFWISGGVGMLHSDPMTDHMGQQRMLREFGTEGQLLDGGTFKAPWYLSTPLGIEAEIGLNAAWSMSLRLSYNLAWTDYLDDVSGYYPQMAELEDQVGIIAVALSDRGRPNDIDTMRDLSGQRRGDHTRHDGFLLTSLVLSYRW